jgi:predicted transcriptional regulator
MDRQLNFRADEDLAEALIAACRREDRTQSSLIRYALRRYLSNESAQPAEAGRSQSRGLDHPANEA